MEVERDSKNGGGEGKKSLSKRRENKDRGQMVEVE